MQCKYKTLLERLHTCPGMASSMETRLREEASGSLEPGVYTQALRKKGWHLGPHSQLRSFQGSVGNVSSLTDLVAAGSSAGYLVGVVENGTGEDGDPR